MFNWLSTPRLNACVLVVGISLLLTGCNLNQSPTNETLAVTGAPQVRIIAPQPNAILLEGASIPIQAQVTNAGADIARVDVLIDGAVAQTFASPNESGAPAFSIAHTWVAAGIGAHTIDVVAFRADESSSEPAVVSVSVVEDTAIETQEVEPTTAVTTGGQTTRPANTAAPAGGTTPQTQPTAGAQNTAAPTDAPASATSTRPQVTVRTGANIRSGPGIVFNPPIGSLAAGATADLLGRDPSGQWYKIRYYNADGWISASLVDVSGDTSNLPVDAGPPPPAPTVPPPVVIPTGAPVATAAPATAVNIVIGNITTQPGGDQLCGQTFRIFVDVANLGTAANTSSGSIRVRNLRVADSSEQGSTVGGFGIIQPGQTINVGPIPLTVNTFYGEQHRLVITVNPDGAVPETNNQDNTRELTYTLQKGSCP
ncbi:MAG: SH3 domain-containing protein [Chloroflexota bacterium]|nr:SH3 domain-containing protein [Chloroflexota bacterium]